MKRLSYFYNYWYKYRRKYILYYPSHWLVNDNNYVNPIAMSHNTNQYIVLQIHMDSIVANHHQIYLLLQLRKQKV